MPAPPIPITMTGTLDHCLLLSFRAPAATVRPLVPRALDLVTLDARSTTWAFFNVVLCHVAQMRPVFAPRALGLSYHHAAYRVMVSANAGPPAARSAPRAPRASARNSSSPPELRGLYFLRSDADHPLINFGGNLFSDFRFHPARITARHEHGLFLYRVESRDHQADASVTIFEREGPPHVLRADSVFASLDEARAFLKYQPLGLCPARDGAKVRLAEVFRDESGWHEDLVHVSEVSLPYLDRLTNNTATLELATRLAPIEYRWRLGRSLPLGNF